MRCRVQTQGLEGCLDPCLHGAELCKSVDEIGTSLGTTIPKVSLFAAQRQRHFLIARESSCRWAPWGCLGLAVVAASSANGGDSRGASEPAVTIMAAFRKEARNVSTNVRQRPCSFLSNFLRRFELRGLFVHRLG